MRKTKEEKLNKNKLLRYLCGRFNIAALRVLPVDLSVYLFRSNF